MPDTQRATGRAAQGKARSQQGEAVRGAGDRKTDAEYAEMTEQQRRQAEEENGQQSQVQAKDAREKFDASVAAVADGTKKLCEGGAQAAHAGPLAMQLWCQANGQKYQPPGG